MNKTQVKLVRGYYAVDSTRNDEYVEQLALSYDKGGYIVTEITDELHKNIEKGLYLRGLIEIAPLKNAQVRVEDFYPHSLLVEARTTTQEINWEKILVDPLSIQFSDNELSRLLTEDIWTVLEESVQKLGLPKVAEESRDFFGRKKGDKRRLVKTIYDYKTWFSQLPTVKERELRSYLEQTLPGLTVSVNQWHSVPFFELIESSLIEIFTRRIRYLGANRLAPTMLFTPDISANWSEVGITGANVASALREHGKNRITFWDPELRQVRPQVELNEAVSQWLKFFQLVEKVEAEDRGKLGTMLKLHATGVKKELDLTSVGFGTSQVLPIIVQGLLTPPQSIFIVEQPEVHLHPRVQSQLAYFFFALTRVGIQCIVETHSEYIVNQLRLLIKANPNLRQQVKIYFAERKPESGTQFEEVVLNEKGTITNWPKGFMDESAKLAQEMLLAAAESA